MTSEQRGLSRHYSDRARSPAETVALMRPHLWRFGITRVANQTGLDKSGIPCFAAIRPNALSLSTNQGKGLDNDGARASAVMEAFEFAVAEQPASEVFRLSVAELERARLAYLDCHRSRPIGAKLDPGQLIRWVRGQDMLTGEWIMVPLGAVSLSKSHCDLPGLAQHTNGLASGNNEDEAVFHALCELLERDAITLWELRAADGARDSSFSPDVFDDPAINQLSGQVARSGLSMRLFDISSDLCPAAFALIGKPSGDRNFLHLAAGYGAHPSMIRACIRAITEAAQSRITFISGSRDDFSPELYDDDAQDFYRDLLVAQPRNHVPELGVPLDAPLSDLSNVLIERLRGSDLAPIAKVRLDSSDIPFAVVKILAPGLEDRDANRNWRPGSRAIHAMTRQ